MGCRGEDPHHRAIGDSLGCSCASMGWGGQHGHHPCRHRQCPRGPAWCPWPCVCAGRAVVARWILQLVLGCGDTGAARGICGGAEQAPGSAAGSGDEDVAPGLCTGLSILRSLLPSSLKPGTRCLAECVPLAPAVPQAGHDSRLPGDVRNVTVTHRGELWGYGERVSLSSPVRRALHHPCTALARLGGPGGAGGGGGQQGTAGDSQALGLACEATPGWLCCQRGNRRLRPQRLRRRFLPCPEAAILCPRTPARQPRSAHTPRGQPGTGRVPVACSGEGGGHPQQPLPNLGSAGCCGAEPCDGSRDKGLAWQVSGVIGRWDDKSKG